MNKAKKIWQENKVLLVLAIILLVCVIVFISVAITYFYGSSSSVYGNRLDIVEKVPLKSEKLNSVKENLESDSNILSANLNVKGKIVYIRIKMANNTKMDDAKKLAEAALTEFSEEELEVYDIQFTISSIFDDNKDSYTLMGARNANGSGIVMWSNYNITESAE